MSMSEVPLFNQVEAAAHAISRITAAPPRAAVVLGTGLGNLVKQIENLKELIAIHKEDPSIIEKRRQVLAAMMKPKTEESDEV